VTPKGAIVRRVLVVVFVLAAALVPAVAGSAQEGEPGIVLIMDASGSMNQAVGDGVTLMDEAKAALREIVLRIPSDTEVGLRVYGHRVPNDDKANGCVDTELIVPVGPIDRGELLAAVGEFDARGFTPIGLSLQEAAVDLGPGGGTIILVSDGIDTCAPPDPCEVARQLAEEGITSHIHTVGLFLQDQAAVDQLRCIADAGNGTFTGVESVDGILSALTGVVDEAVEGGLQGLRIEGALERNLAPVIPWRDDEPFDLALVDGVLPSGAARWFAVEVTQPSVQLAATLNIDWQPNAEPDEYIEVRIFDENGIEIGVPHEVAGVIVDAPQRMVLVEAGDWLGSQAGNAWPTALATTDPITMYPSWEANESFFAPTVERFHEAGLNGGVYEAFKRQPPADPLVPGTYYVAVQWESDRPVETGMQLGVTAYPIRPEEDDWRTDRPSAPVRIDDGSLVPFPLDPVRWSGGEIGGGLPEPTRAIEVWSAHDGSPEQYTIDLTAGEILVVGWDYWIPYSPETHMGDVAHELTLTSPVNPVSPVDFDEEFARLGFMESRYFRATETGEYTLTMASIGADLDAEPAYAIGVFVLPPEAFQVLESFGISGWDPGASQSGGDAPAAGDALRDRARAAVMAGLRAVADAQGG
jgi:Ca-activated chloride channel family protein